MAKLHEITVESHSNIYTGEQRSIPMVYATPDAGIDENTAMLVISYGYGAGWKANIFNKLLNKLPDLYNMVVVTGYYFGAKYVEGKTIEIRVSAEDQDEEAGFHRIRYSGENISEFNDMGIMQAMDLIYMTLQALNCIGKRSDELRHIMIFGSSHGGYLSYLANILCPNLFSFIIDVSAYTFPYFLHKNRILRLSGKYFEGLFGFDYLINRDETTRVDEELLDLKKLYAERMDSCRVISFHGEVDWMVPLEDKSEFLGLIGENGQLIVITEKDIDGNFIKNANHGLDINFEILLDAMIPTILDNVMERKELQEGEHSFLGGKLVVNIKDGKPNITTIKMKE